MIFSALEPCLFLIASTRRRKSWKRLRKSVSSMASVMLNRN
jgi:hypothetical protein